MALVSTAGLHLRTAFVLNDAGRIVSTREPRASSGPLFTLVRAPTGCAWAARADLPEELAVALERLAREEPHASDLRDAPVHADRYVSLLGGRLGPGQDARLKTRQSDGPVFSFPDASPSPVATDIVIEDERLLERHFRGWVPGEIAAGRSPVVAILDGGNPVSVCFCARRSDTAAAAGVETAEHYRRRGFAARVTAAWAAAIRGTGRTPLYNTDWTNDASLAVARKLHLSADGSTWSLSD